MVEGLQCVKNYFELSGGNGCLSPSTYAVKGVETFYLFFPHVHLRLALQSYRLLIARAKRFASSLS